MSATVPLTETITPTSETQDMVYATFWRRVSAAVIDTVGFFIAIFIPSSIVGRAAVDVHGPGSNLLLLLALDDLWMLRDPHRQTLHDKLAGTYVVAAGSAR
jgi:uncharacterized RDD family membrane protein YckC